MKVGTTIAACVSLASVALAAVSAPVTRQPNFLVIFTDDQTYRAIGYNNPAVKTPHLDKLAVEGLIFNNAYVASPICAASRAAMMSGVFPQQNGVIALHHQGFKKYRDGGVREEQTLARHLQKAGYHCAFWGKSHIGSPIAFGFDEGKETRSYDDTEAFKLAEAFLEKVATRSKPFFLWLAPRQPHVPLKPKQKWLDLYDENTFRVDPNFRESPIRKSISNQGVAGKSFFRDSNYRNNWRALPAGPPRDKKTIRQFMKAFYATISHLDDQVGRLVERLETLGLDDNTVIIFLSDNGYHLGNHGLGNKITMHEESVRVPMFIHWSGLEAKGKRSDALVSSLDVYPTLLGLARAPLPEHIMGRSLMPLLENPSAPFREVVFSECTGVGGKPDEGHRMARSNRWKLVVSDTDEEYLFDQLNDPFELNNLASSPEQGPVLKRLRGELKQWMQAIGDRPFPAR